MKKIISIFLSLLIVMCGCVTAFCANDSAAKINVNVDYAKEVKVGDTLTVTVSTADNPGFCGVQFVLGYDKTVLQCTEASIGEALSGTMNATNKDGADGAAVVAASATTINKNGTIATIKFKVLKEGNYGFSFKQMIIADYNCNDLDVSTTFATENTSVTPSNNDNTEPSTDPQNETDTNNIFKSIMNKIQNIFTKLAKLEISKNFVLPQSFLNGIQKMFNTLLNA